ncbi:hypothetical protein [uncultured Microbulbifer sp.]|uniref:hypothetical protein n=1 Tax=uncultured Microbulbifer sp. TaxID=348147 RepID=UPI00260E47C1|nr:hypothetical protein [uncultured Microbulbifer sp.]
MKKLFSILVALLALLSASLAQAAPRVLIVATSHEQMGDTSEKTGLWLSELTHPYHELKKAGFEVEIASIKGGAVPVDARSLADDDAVNFEFLASRKPAACWTTPASSRTSAPSASRPSCSPAATAPCGTSPRARR